MKAGDLLQIIKELQAERRRLDIIQQQQEVVQAGQTETIRMINDLMAEFRKFSALIQHQNAAGQKEMIDGLGALYRSLGLRQEDDSQPFVGDPTYDDVMNGASEVPIC